MCSFQMKKQKQCQFKLGTVSNIYFSHKFSSISSHSLITLETFDQHQKLSVVQGILIQVFYQNIHNNWQDSMIQDTEDYDDMFSGLPPEVLQNLYIRYYVMEEYFEISLEDDNIAKPVAKDMPLKNTQKDSIKEENPASKAPLPETVGKKYGMSMVFNRIIQETICNLHLMNKLVEKKAKMVAALLGNGREIAERKSSHWNQFLRTPAFSKISLAVSLLPKPQQKILKYSIMAISNLLLKLGINMSKVSVIPLQKFCTFQCLSIPTLSILFLQYLQYQLFKSKNIADPNQQATFLRQLPKVSVVKLCKYKNNTDIETFEARQEEFFSKNNIKNLQFIQIHQKSSDPIYPNYKRKTNYFHIMQYDLQAMSKGKVCSPFKFEILLLMRNIIFALVKDFKPDMIVYIEDYPSNERAMDEEARGLMLCELAEHTCCNKMYMFRQVGLDKLSLAPDSKDSFTEIYNKQEGEQITKENLALMLKWEEKYFKKYEQIMFMSGETKKEIELVKKILLDDLVYISLALIQKTSFEAVEQRSHMYFYDKDYLEGIKRELHKLCQQQEAKNIQKHLAIKSQGINSMIWALGSKENQNSNTFLLYLNENQGEFHSFFNQMEQREQNLVTDDGFTFTYSSDDIFHVKYLPEKEKLIVFIIKYDAKKKLQLIVLSKCKGAQCMKKQKIINLPVEQNYLEGATYVCSGSYLFRGFGKYRVTTSPNQPTYNTAIHCFQFEPEFGSGWELVADKSVGIKPDGKEENNKEMEKKKYGYGIWSGQNSTILFMGGYLESWNEEKISKTIYMIRKADQPSAKKKVESLGKTNKLLFQGKINAHFFLHPFVFGIPFSTNNSMFIINGNGAYMNLSNYNKIFLTTLKISAVSPMYTGILKQGKLKIPEDVDTASKVILFAEMMNKCMVSFCNQVNVFGGTCCIRIEEEGDIIVSPVAQDINKNQMKDEKEQKAKGSKINCISMQCLQILESQEKVYLEFMI